MAPTSVFHDPTGRRGRLLRVVAAAAALLGGAAGVAFVGGVLAPPHPDPLPMSAPLTVRPDLAPTACAAESRGGATCPARRAVAMPRPRLAAAPVADPIIAAFAVQWDGGSRRALARHADRLDWIIVEGAFLGRGAPGEVTVTLDPDLRALAADRGVALHLMVTNYGRTDFDSTLVTATIAEPARRRAAVAALADAVRRDGLAGVMVDFERVPAWRHADVLAFLRALRTALAPQGATLSVAVPISEGDGYPLRAYADAADYVVPMLYDQHADEGAAGPIAAADWYAARLEVVLQAVPAHRVLAGLGQYGYHWRSDRDRAVTLSVPEARALAAALPGGLRFDPVARNATASWQDARGTSHTVWSLDAATTWNQWRVAHRTGVAGLALWRLGGEDGATWSILGRHGLDETRIGALDTLPSDGVAALLGEGEVLAVSARRGHGRQIVRQDPEGYISDVRVAQAPGGWLVARAGAAPRQVALTFDDGPDPDVTPFILDTLASRGAVASFFVVGRQVQHVPALARRIAEEGHEIGNHSWSHADYATLDDDAIRHDLAAAGRVIEAVTGRRPLLARPPYIGDARPATEDRLRPMAVAGALGYRIAGLEVDTRDWEERTPEGIVANALRALDAGRGRILLLHDAGGDRAATIAALGPLIDSLRARGYALTTVAGLVGAAPDAAMPAAPPDEAPQRLLVAFGLHAANGLELLLAGLFAAALVLGSIRLVVIGTLAVVQRRTPRLARRQADAIWRPRLSVLVPAFDEENVIARTMRSVLAQAYPDLELLVIDDGSRDGTRAAALAVAADDPRAYVLHQPNGGKAAALNHGLRAASGEVIVVIDADTVLAPDALRHLVRPLSDARVGAVAGNAKVGNRVNLVTRWQAVEYVTSQNLDRRAFELLNCITVVPGAIGAWRREAVLAAGGFRSDTLAEDQDLTLTLLRQGQRIAMAEQAIAWTEAPETVGALLKQRFRWTFGTLQCAWKHRAAFLRPSAGALGLVGLPNVLLFQLLFPLLAPLADLALLGALSRWWAARGQVGAHAAWSDVAPVIGLYAAFLAVDTLAALIGLALEPAESKRQAWLVPLQRFVYRQVLYVALLRAVRAALVGWTPGWNKLARTGRVAEPAEALAGGAATAPAAATGLAWLGPERRRS